MTLPRPADPQFLRRVSRTFALSIRTVPAALRPAVEVGYLIARLGDTVADHSTVPPDDRRDRLAQIRAALTSGQVDPVPFVALADSLDPGGRSVAAESQLLRGIESLLTRHRALDLADRAAVEAVVDQLLRTMEAELTWFFIDRRGPFRDSAQLLAYAEGIAGCVGAFWTRLLVVHRCGVTSAAERSLARIGRRYGRGLQLVNILRDQRQDALRGCQFIPDGDRASWWKVAHFDLLAGYAYARRLPRRAWRLRFATLLPAVLGLATLDRLRSTVQVASAPTPPKISKWGVALAAIRTALWCALH